MVRVVEVGSVVVVGVLLPGRRRTPSPPKLSSARGHALADANKQIHTHTHTHKLQMRTRDRHAEAPGDVDELDVEAPPLQPLVGGFRPAAY